MFLPSYDFLPAPFWLITLFQVVTLTLHFIAMNFVLGGVVIVLWGKFGNRWEDPTVRRFIKLFPSSLAATITFGVAPLLFVQLLFPKQVYSAAIVSGWFWLAIIPAIMVAYYLFYAASFSIEKNANSSRLQWMLSIALFLLVYVSFIYSSVFSLAERPDLVRAMYESNQSGLLINPNVGDYIIRWLHMLFGAITVGGFFVGVIGKDNPPAYRIGKLFFMMGMGVASLFGFIYMMTLGEILLPLMRSPAIWILTVGIVLSAGSIHFFFKKRFLPSGAMLFTGVLSMVITRHYVRLLSLKPTFDPSALPVSPQWTILAIFIFCFLAMIALMVYMFRLYFRGTKESPTA